MIMTIKPFNDLTPITIPNPGLAEAKSPARSEELITIPDECGDSLWDVVLEQETEHKDQGRQN